MPVWLDPPAITKFAYEQAAGAEAVAPLRLELFGALEDDGERPRLGHRHLHLAITARARDPILNGLARRGAALRAAPQKHDASALRCELSSCLEAHTGRATHSDGTQGGNSAATTFVRRPVGASVTVNEHTAPGARALRPG